MILFCRLFASPAHRLRLPRSPTRLPAGWAGVRLVGTVMDEDTRIEAFTGPDLLGCRHRMARILRGDPAPPAAPPDPARRPPAPHWPAGATRIGPGADADLATLEAIAAGAPLILDAVLPMPGDAGVPERARADALVRWAGPHGYLPVRVTGHGVLAPRRGGGTAAARVLDPAALAAPEPARRVAERPALRVRERRADAVALGQAAAALDALGAGCGLVGVLGADRSALAVAAAAPRIGAYRRARGAVAEVAAGLAAGVVPPPRRVRQCRGCRWRAACEARLRAADDISLVLPGDRADRLRARGIGTVRALAGAEGAGEAAWLARAAVAGIPAVRRVPVTAAPRAAVEVDVDVEAYPGAGPYLWGAWTAGGYRPFVSWAAPGTRGAEEALGAAFARFWAWLSGLRRQAAAGGRSFAAYCWAAEAENRWLRQSAAAFGGRRFDGPGGPVTAPTRAEVDALLGSAQWVDLFRVTRTQLLAPGGLGLKQVAPWAGFRWRDPEAGGEGSLAYYRVAAGISPGDAAAARATLLRYNADDCRSMAVIRDWLGGEASRVLPHGADLPAPVGAGAAAGRPAG